MADRMSVCRFYLQGNCRYGNACSFAHGNANGPRPNYHHHSNDSSFRPRFPRPQVNPQYRFVAPNASYGQPIPKQYRKFDYVLKWAEDSFGANKEKALDILQQLQKEARVWQKSASFWRFTSRSLFPGGQPLAVWNDQSFEEIRWFYRCMSEANQIHNYKKAYYDYFENTERQLNGLGRLNADTLESFKPYILQFIQSPYLPSSTLATDIEMSDGSDNPTPAATSTTDTRNYTPDDQLLEDERAAFASDTFEFGQIPTHAPSKQFC